MLKKEDLQCVCYYLLYLIYMKVCIVDNCNVQCKGTDRTGIDGNIHVMSPITMILNCFIWHYLNGFWWRYFHFYPNKLLRTMLAKYKSFHNYCALNTLRSRQNGRHFTDDIFKCIFLNENVWISINISLKFVPKVQINNIPTLVQIMAWRRPGDKPLSASMVVSLPTHICVTRPQWVRRVQSAELYSVPLKRITAF